MDGDVPTFSSNACCGGITDGMAMVSAAAGKLNGPRGSVAIMKGH